MAAWLSWDVWRFCHLLVRFNAFNYFSIISTCSIVLLVMILVARSNMQLLQRENQAQYNRAKQHNNPYESTVCLTAYSVWLLAVAISYVCAWCNSWLSLLFWKVIGAKFLWQGAFSATIQMNHYFLLPSPQDPLFPAGLPTHFAPSACASDLASPDHCAHLQIIFSYLLTYLFLFVSCRLKPHGPIMSTVCHQNSSYFILFVM